MSVLPHLLPYLIYILLGYATEVVPPSLVPWIDPVRGVLVLLTLLVFWKRGAYPELATRETAAPRAGMLAVAAGLVVAVIWIPLATVVPPLGEARGGFDLNAAGESWAGALVLGRLLSFVLVIPFAEELFVRSLVPRYVDTEEGDWRSRPVGVFTPLSFAVSVGLFTITHPEWLAALVTGALWMLLLEHTRRLRDVVVAHAVANGALTVYILASGDMRWW